MLPCVVLALALGGGAEFGAVEGQKIRMKDHRANAAQRREQFLKSFERSSKVPVPWHFLNHKANEAKEDAAWEKKHALLMETAKDEPDPDLNKLREGRNDTKAQIALVMAETRLSSGLWAASVSQKAAYARKHGYGFHISASGRYVYDPNYTTIPKFKYTNARPLIMMCSHILNQPAAADFNEKLKAQLQKCADIDKSPNPEHGIGAARAATLDAALHPDYKMGLWMMLDNVNPPNANYEQDFGVLEGTWSKVSATIEAMQAVPEGSWLWVLDTDIAIMDDTQPIDYIVNEAEKRGADFIACTWNCGDGLNMGSVMVKNSEFGRALYQKLKDMRVVWHLYFFHSATGNTEQGAMWTYLAADEGAAGRLWAGAPPRTFNNRHELIKCAGEKHQVAQVYYHEGDFLIHYAALIRGTVGMNSFLENMNKTGWWPCSEKRCTKDLLQSTIGKPAHPLGADAAAGAGSVSVIFVDNSTSDAAGRRRTAMQEFAKSHSLRWVGSYDKDFYLEGGEIACIDRGHLKSIENLDEQGRLLRKKYSGDGACPQEPTTKCTASNVQCHLDYDSLMQMWVPSTQPIDELPAPLGSYKAVGEGSSLSNGRSYRRGQVHFSSNGWAKVAIAIRVLREMQESDSEQWLLIADGSSDQESDDAVMKSLISDIKSEDASTGKVHLGLRHDCKGPWLVRSSEWSRIFMDRVAAGLLAHDDRMHGASSAMLEERVRKGYVRPELSIAEKAIAAGASESLCLVLRRDRTTDGAVQWLTSPPADAGTVPKEGFFTTSLLQSARLHRQAYGYSRNDDLRKYAKQQRGG